MKSLVVMGVVVVGVALAILFGWRKEASGPEPLTFGKDVCGHCRMIVSRPGFAGELRDRNGTLTKYDDLGCMLETMFRAHQEFPEAWVEDHATGGFVPFVEATFVAGPGLKTPMEHNIVAFRDPVGAAKFAEERKLGVVTVEALMSHPTKFMAKKGGVRL